MMRALWLLILTFLAGPAFAQTQTIIGATGLNPQTGTAVSTTTDYRVALGTKVDVTGGILNGPTLNSPIFPNGIVAANTLSTQIMQFGSTDPSYGPFQTIIPIGGLAVRSPVSGCGDQGSAFSALTSWAIDSVAAGIATHSGPCQNTLAEIAAGGNFDSVAVSLQNGGGFPVLQPPLAATPYDATHVYFSPALTSAQIALLPPDTFVLTNSVDGSGNPFGSYITSVASNGSSATVVGWAALGTNNAATGQVPPTVYKSGTGSSPAVYLGAAVNLFGENTVCGNTTWPMLLSTQCYEIDVVPVSGGSGAIYGMVFESLGGASTATGIIFPANSYSFYNDITLLGFANNGITIAPSSSPTGSGLYIYMQTGTPITIACGTGGTSCNGSGYAFVVDKVGNTTISGSLVVDGNAQFYGQLNISGYLGEHSATVSTFGSGCSPGTFAYASNGRKAGEGAGSGTGVPVVCTMVSGTPTWVSMFTGTALAG